MKRILYILIFCVSFHFCGLSQTSEVNTERILHFYPNPAINYINFEIPETFDKEYSLQIYNFIGKKVIDLPNLSSKINLPLNDFFRGIYIFQLRNKIGKIVESGKFQVVK